MRELELLHDLDVFTSSAANRRRCPFADAIHRDNGGFCKRRWVESARRMGKMVFWKIDRCISLTQLREAVFKHAPHKNFFFDPYKHRGYEADKAARCERVIGFQKPFELEEWLFIKRNGRKILIVDSCLFQDVSASVDRKGRVVLFPRKALFLSGSHDLAIDKERGSAIVVERRYPEYCFFHSISFRLMRICS